ncbi:MAG: AMP-binding protein [Pseudomonadota bacterium]
MNMFELLAQSARRSPQRGAVYRGTEQVWTYGQLCDRARRLATALRRHGQPGDRVAVASENRTEYLEAMYGIWAAGMVFVPINAKLHAKEMVQILEDAEATAVFVSPKLADDLAAALKASSQAGCRLLRIGSADYAALFDNAPMDAPVTAPEALAWLFYTSGTTGRSKGAMLSHRNLMAMTISHLAEMETFGEDASQIHAAPMSHGSGLYIPAYIARGARQVLPASGAFDPAEFLDLCDAHPSCGAFLAPTMVQRLRLEAERSGRRPAHLRSIVYGGAPMYVEELKKSLATFGPVLTQLYGQGEAPMTITALRRHEHIGADDATLGSAGTPRLGMDVRVVDDEGRPCPIDAIGEIVCRGDVVMSGYWRNPKATAEALRDGWLYTGDMGSFDAHGRLTLRDRSKDVVISGGSNIYPREVEEALLTHPGVSEACVVGEPDAEWGEVVVAFVVPVDGAAADCDALDAHCLNHIARFKRPKRYVFIDALPKSNYGKVLKRELRLQLATTQGANT